MKIQAQIRTDLGKGASRRLRHNGQLPAIVYGGKEAPLSITLDQNQLLNKMGDSSFYESIIIEINGKDVKVKPQDVQRHPFKPKVQHMDFIRI